MPHPVDLVVNGRILLDISIRGSYVRFRLIVIIVRDKVFDGILREKLLEFCIELTCKGLVVGKDERGTLKPLDDICHGECLARTRNAQERLCGHAALYTFDYAVYRLGLVTRRLKI